jgi:hypothetical protein
MCNLPSFLPRIWNLLPSPSQCLYSYIDASRVAPFADCKHVSLSAQVSGAPARPAGSERIYLYIALINMEGSITL